MARWLGKPRQFNFTVIHCPTEAPSNADALSRMPCRKCSRDVHATPALTLVHPVAAHTPWELQQQQENDLTLKILLQAKDTDKKPDLGRFQHHTVKAQRTPPLSIVPALLHSILPLRVAEGMTTIGDNVLCTIITQLGQHSNKPVRTCIHVQDERFLKIGKAWMGTDTRMQMPGHKRESLGKVCLSL